MPSKQFCEGRKEEIGGSRGAVHGGWHRLLLVKVWRPGAVHGGWHRLRGGGLHHPGVRCSCRGGGELRHPVVRYSCRGGGVASSGHTLSVQGQGLASSGSALFRMGGVYCTVQQCADIPLHKEYR
eukprot:365456-Chlamydomonas_euryale.AAC.5